MHLPTGPLMATSPRNLSLSHKQAKGTDCLSKAEALVDDQAFMQAMMAKADAFKGALDSLQKGCTGKLFPLSPLPCTRPAMDDFKKKIWYSLFLSI